MLGPQREVARAPDRPAGGGAERGERDVESLARSLERIQEPRVKRLPAHGGVPWHVAPDLGVGSRLEQPLLVLGRERLEHHESSLQPGGKAFPHGIEATRRR